MNEVEAMIEETYKVIVRNPNVVKRALELFETELHCYYGAALKAEFDWIDGTSLYGGKTKEEKEALKNTLLKKHTCETCSTYYESR